MHGELSLSLTRALGCCWMSSLHEYGSGKDTGFGGFYAQLRGRGAEALLAFGWWAVVLFSFLSAREAAPGSDARREPGALSTSLDTPSVSKQTAEKENPQRELLSQIWVDKGGEVKSWTRRDFIFFYPPESSFIFFSNPPPCFFCIHTYARTSTGGHASCSSCP